MRNAIVAIVLCLCGAVSPPQGAADRLVFKHCGFSIAPLDEPIKGTAQLLTMYLPSANGVAPNVNVLTQQYAGSLEEYATLSKTQFQAAKLTLLLERKMGKNAVIFEYSGAMQARLLHFYAKAVLKSGTIYLVTGTATEDQWKPVSEKLKACVDSFETIQGEKEARGGVGPSAEPTPR